MWKKPSLRSRILIIAATLTCLTIGGGLISLWYTYRTNSYIRQVLDDDVAALEVADQLEKTLVMQKGYLTYFFQDGQESWLDELDRLHRGFQEQLVKAGAYALSGEEQGLIAQMDKEYKRLKVMRDQVIELYKSGRRQEGYELHQAARNDFFKIIDLAQTYRLSHQRKIARARDAIDQRANYMITLSLAAMPLAAYLSALLAFVLVRQILGPLRRLAQVAARAEAVAGDRDEVQALSLGVQSLMEDVGQARSELEASRTRLLQAAKMASVGKLAASVAHSIRNPLTSVKMRLYSLERKIGLSEAAREDFTVISEEIRHIDNVLRNFLEFSRRPKLKFQRLSPSAVVDLALDLMRPRFESAGIELKLARFGRLPEIEADPDQLKEALVNLLVNASEAVGPRGRIFVREETNYHSSQGRRVLIRVEDNGAGVPQALLDQIFQPFFSTKDQGTGLGLSIAMRIVEEHGGTLEVETPPEGGAIFSINLPVTEVRVWEKSLS
ncbi:MAG: ATP-binding protein [Thermodesulfobacteriota bacterium]